MRESDYDRYWRERDDERTRARSRVRALLALSLLGRALTRQSRPRLLDVGCGPGWSLEVFRGAGYDVRGLDVSPHAVNLARGRGLDAQICNLEEGEIPGQYDVAVALEVLEHLAEPLAILRSLKGALLPGGRLVISLPNEFHLGRRLAILVGRVPFGGHDDPHLRHFDDRHARRLFAAAGLRVVARLSDSLMPPRWKLLKGLLAPLVGLLPGLFALANVFLLEVESTTSVRPAGDGGNDE